METGALAALLPPEIGAGVAAMLLLVSFAGSFITAAFGIGGGVLVLAVLASLMPAPALIPVHGVVQLGSNAGRAALMLRHLHRPAIPAFVVGSLIGCAVGGLIVVDLPAGAVQAGVGLFVLWSVFRKPPAWFARFPWVSGAVSSFLTMFFGATGTFVAASVKALTLPRQDHVATHAVMMTVQHGLKVVVFGILGFAFGPWIWLVAGMIVAGFGGTYAGRQVLERMTDVNFRRALDIVLILLSLRLIWAGVSSV